MTTEHALVESKGLTDEEALIALLDPDRDYGSRTFEEVVSGVRDGTLRIAEGNRLPMLRDGQGQPIKGGGQPIQTGVSAQQVALSQFRKLALDDVPFAYKSLVSGIKRQDPRYDKIYWDMLVGRVGEQRGGDAMADAFKALIEAMKQPEERTIEVEAS